MWPHHLLETSGVVNHHFRMKSLPPRLLTLPFLALLTLVCSAAADEDAPGFASEVRPILARNCFACHGADAAARKGELRLDVSPVGEGSTVIVPGKPDESDLITRISSTDPDTVMPPPDSGHQLTAQQKQTLRRWIEAGAEYQQHWAFVPPVRPPLPQHAQDQWSETDIDRFILHQIRRHGLEPSPRTNRETLIRRVALDLTGLPPDPILVRKYLADKSPDAYVKAVDTLLQSPRFGEHWASLWLDLARYADTKGYEKDQPRNIWRYRDWVIAALNNDMPYDQFTTEQLAGDLLSDASSSQVLATAFHRNTMTNDEGGTDNEEFRLAAVKDRVDTTVQVWMGLTMGCAKCHSHKYDPISQKEYYQFLAWFNQTEDADRGDDSPRAATPTVQQQQEIAKLETRLNDLRDRRDRTSPDFERELTIWADNIASRPQWELPRPIFAESANGSTLTVQPDQSILASGEQPAKDVYTITLQVEPGEPITTLRVEALTHPSLPQKGPGRNESDPNFVLSELAVTVIDAGGNKVSDAGFGRAEADFSQNRWQVEKAVDGNASTGWAISPRFGQRHTGIFVFAQPLKLEEDQQLKVALSQQYPNTSLLFGCVRLGVSRDNPWSLDATGALAEAAALQPAQRSDAQKDLLRQRFRNLHPETRQLTNEIQNAEKQLAQISKSVVQTPVMKELPKNRQRKTHIHVRGNFLEKGEEVTAGFPKSFAIKLSEPSGDRRDVAAWLLAKENPLTARVAVNRIWSRFFGRGFVETEEDFGTQGMSPSHPRLLDWLAVEYRDGHSWSLKQLCRQIVLSSVYQQSSVVSQKAQEQDPENRWLSHSPRFRLSAETVRDQSLAVSGLLSDKIGGPSVMPPQPSGIWKTTYSRLKWVAATGEDRYRRGLYTFLRRTSPYPSMITFDGTSREVCQIRRIRTNTPLQALVTLNDPVFLEAAGALAASVNENPESAAISEMFRRVLVRRPTEQELDALRHMQATVAAEFLRDDQAREAFLGEIDQADTPGNLKQRRATLAVVASVILNLDETLMKP